MATLAFLLITAGVLVAYGEFIWVGRLIFGVAGCLLVISGMALFSRMPMSASGVGLILLAMVCIGIEAWVQNYWLAGMAAVVLWVSGFGKLGVAWQVAVPVSMVWGGITVWLLGIAKRARRNKFEDVD